MFSGVEEQIIDELLRSLSAEDHATENVTDHLENPAAKHFPASWTFAQISKHAEETVGDVVCERMPSPQTTSEHEVVSDLEHRQSVSVQPCHSLVSTECQLEGEQDDLFLDVGEPAVIGKPTDSCELNRVHVTDRQSVLTMSLRVFYQSETTHSQHPDHSIDRSTLEEVPRLFGLAAKALPTPTRAILQDALQTVEEVSEKTSTSEVSHTYVLCTRYQQLLLNIASTIPTKYSITSCY